MSQPVKDPKWAGDFDCSVCRRKRLIASEFSQNQIKSKPKDQLTCKQCVADREKAERDAAAAKLTAAAAAAALPAAASGASTSPAAADALAPLLCSGCSLSFPSSVYNFNQLKKNDRRKCKSCVDAVVASDVASVASASQSKLEDAKERVRKSEAGGNVAEKLAASMALANLEGEAVTGLKPIRMKDAGKRR